MQTSYAEFLDSRRQLGENAGFEPVWMPDFLFDFQAMLVEWAVRKGRAGIFAFCGAGKTPQQLVWAENVVRKTNKPVLILTPFMGVGSECYGAVKLGRKGIGIELKESYFRQAVKNLEALERPAESSPQFSVMANE